MVHEREGVVLREGYEPERNLCEVDRHGVPVHAVEAALCDESARGNELVLIGWNRWHLAVYLPGLDQCVAKLTARLDQECTRSHCRIADLEVENLLRPGRPADSDA